VYLWDANGKRYLDLLSGIGVNGLGHTHPAVKKAIVKQAGKMLHTSNLFFHEYQAELAAKLTKISGLDRAFFTNSGTEAIEGALKIARAYAQVHNSSRRSSTTTFVAPVFVAFSATSYMSSPCPTSPTMAITSQP